MTTVSGKNWGFIGACLVLLSVLMNSNAFAKPIDLDALHKGFNGNLGELQINQGRIGDGWSTTVTFDTTFSYFMDVCCIPVHGLRLYLDGNPIGWDRVQKIGNRWHVEISNILLTSGKHKIELAYVNKSIARLAGTNKLEGIYLFSPASIVPVETFTAVVPPSIPVLVAALFGLSLLVRRRRLI